jgi:biotin operon repressor
MATPRPATAARELRNLKILELHDLGVSEREIARLVGCSRSTVWNVIQSRKVAA